MREGIAVEQPTAERTGSVWSSWHLHLRSSARSIHDRVLTELIAPAVREVGKPWFFIRYWQAGPHLRLRVGELDQDGFDRLEQSLREGLDTVGQLVDGEEPVNRDDYRTGASKLAAAGETGDDRIVQDLLTPGVHRATYEPEFDRYGGPGLMARTEQLFQLSSELVAGLVPHVANERLRAQLALRGTMAAAAGLGDTAERSYFYAHGLHAWRSLAAEFGYTEEQLVQLCTVATPNGAKPIDADAHGPFAPLHSGIAELVGEVRATTSTHPGQIVSSHVHMLHNRFGLSMGEELRTYAWLASVFPVRNPAPTPVPVIAVAD